jgi:hypothetical protein
VHLINVTQVPGQPNSNSKEFQIEDEVSLEIIVISGKVVDVLEAVSHVVWNLWGFICQANSIHHDRTGSHNSTFLCYFFKVEKLEEDCISRTILYLKN